MMRTGSVRLMGLRTAAPAVAHRRWVETVSGIDTPAPNVVLPWERKRRLAAVQAAVFALDTDSLTMHEQEAETAEINSQNSAFVIMSLPTHSPHHKSSNLSLHRQATTRSTRPTSPPPRPLTAAVPTADAAPDCSHAIPSDLAARTAPASQPTRQHPTYALVTNRAPAPQRVRPTSMV